MAPAVDNKSALRISISIFPALKHPMTRIISPFPILENPHASSHHYHFRSSVQFPFLKHPTSRPLKPKSQFPSHHRSPRPLRMILTPTLPKALPTTPPPRPRTLQLPLTSPTIRQLLRSCPNLLLLSRLNHSLGDIPRHGSTETTDLLKARYSISRKIASAIRG